MNKGLKTLIILLLILIMLLVGMMVQGTKESRNSDKIEILTSFYPIYIMTKNITDGAENVETSNMADKYYGCIHDYTLTTADLQKVENSDVFIQSGNGLEPFTERIVQSYKNLKIINCSESIDNFIQDEDGEKNAHTWLSLDNYKQEVRKIAQRLMEIDSRNSEIYTKNMENYISKIDDVKEKYNSLKLNGIKAICLDESLEYLLRENGIEETLVETDHEQSSLSAEQVKEILEKMKNENIKCIFIDQNDNTKTANLLASETGAKIYKLNSRNVWNK